MQLLLSGEFSLDSLSRLLKTCQNGRVEYTNYGFYVTVHHPDIGKSRRVYHSRTTGRLDDHMAGFVIFLEDDELMLEIFPCDGEALPATFRDSAVQIVDEAPTERI